MSSDTVFLVSLGSTLPGGAPAGRTVGVNQVVWDTESRTLYVESDELLDQHTRYVLIVTRGVRDEAGDPVESPARHSDGSDMISTSGRRGTRHRIFESV